MFKKFNIQITAAMLFVVALMFSAISFAQEAVVQLSPDGTFEDATLEFINALQVGKIGAIIFALITLMKTRPGVQFMNWVIQKVSGKKPVVTSAPVAETPPKDALEEQGYTTLNLGQAPEPAKLSPAVINSTNILLGAGAAVAQAMSAGAPAKQAVITGLLGSGVATAVWELVAKPLIKKFSK